MTRFDADGLARQLVGEYGSDAIVVAVMNADDAMDRGDVRGFNEWHRVARSIRAIVEGDPI